MVSCGDKLRNGQLECDDDESHTETGFVRVDTEPYFVTMYYSTYAASNLVQ
jgi:hypothetical protein